MMKTALILSATLFGAAVPSSTLNTIETSTAEQTINLPKPDAVIAQFSYLELSHGVNGFDLTVTDKTAVFVDVEFSDNLHIRIGF